MFIVGISQGEELENILKKEGIINDEDCVDSKTVKNGTDIIIGTVKLENGEDTGEPVYINKSKVKTENGKNTFCFEVGLFLYRVSLNCMGFSVLFVGSVRCGRLVER